MLQSKCMTWKAKWQCLGTLVFVNCDPTPANEALCGKINFEVWATM